MTKHPNYDRAYAEGVEARTSGAANPYPEGYEEHDFFEAGLAGEEEKELGDEIPV